MSPINKNSALCLIKLAFKKSGYSCSPIHLWDNQIFMEIRISGERILELCFSKNGKLELIDVHDEKEDSTAQ
jgi:hypothetical protein